MKTFKNKEELLSEWEVNGACKEGKNFNISCEDLQEILEICPKDFRLWRLAKGYSQFSEHCEWSKLSGGDWSYLLRTQPQFSEHCEWSKLGGCAWANLLKTQPQFSEHCEWSKLGGGDWANLLETQPQFSEHCEWSKLGGGAWSYLLKTQPQFSEMKDGNSRS